MYKICTVEVFTLNVRDYLVHRTSACKLPWQFWHCVHNLANFSSSAFRCEISFWKSADSFGLQCLQTAAPKCQGERSIQVKRCCTLYDMISSKEVLYDPQVLDSCVMYTWLRRNGSTLLSNLLSTVGLDSQIKGPKGWICWFSPLTWESLFPFLKWWDFELLSSLHTLCTQVC